MVNRIELVNPWKKIRDACNTELTCNGDVSNRFGGHDYETFVLISLVQAQQEDFETF